jgi:CRP-like cAMP-binding protein
MARESLATGQNGGSPRAAAPGIGHEHLERVAIFAGLTPTQLDKLAPLLRRKTVPERQRLFEAEAPGEVAYIIHKGYVRIEMTKPDGSELIFAILGPGDIVGEMSLLDRAARSASAIAHEPLELFTINMSVFGALFERVPQISRNLNHILARRLRIANALILAMGTMEVEGRIIQQLLTYAREYGQPLEGTAVRLPFRLTQSEIGALVGASRVRVNQVLIEYKRRGLITVGDRHRITLLDPDALAAEVS